MALIDYTIDTSGSPQDVQRRQKLADTLMQQGMDSSPAAGGKNGGWITALNRGLAGALGGYQRASAANEEQQGLSSARQQMASLLQGKQLDPTSAAMLATNPWASPTQVSAINSAYTGQHQLGREGVEDKYRSAADARAAAAEGRASYEFEHTPDQYVPNPKAGQPNEPAYVDQYAAAKTGAANNDFQVEVDKRKAAATSIGLTPDHPGYNSFVLTGKMPREDAQPLTATDKKAILDAEEKLQSSKATIANLQHAKQLSPQAMQGPGASTRGYLSSFLGGSSDLGKAGIATQDLENLVTTNALQSLKSIFGGNPTEGERAILLDVQGSVGKPDAVRQKIYDRAIEAANRRLAFEQQRIDEMRGGKFYKPEGGLSKGAGTASDAPDPLGIR